MCGPSNCTPFLFFFILIHCGSENLTLHIFLRISKTIALPIFHDKLQHFNRCIFAVNSTLEFTDVSFVFSFGLYLFLLVWCGGSGCAAYLALVNCPTLIETVDVFLEHLNVVGKQERNSSRLMFYEGRDGNSG